MANLRVLYNNLADTAIIAASSNAGTSYGITNVQNIKKTSFHRSSLTNTVTYTLTWFTDQSINAVALPATNLIDGATIRVVLYNSANAVLADSTTVTACKNKISLSKTDYLGSTFPYTGATKTSIFFPSSYTTVRKVTITLINTNTSMSVDCARIICGNYWEGSRQASNGINIGVVDSSVVSTTRAGDTYVDRRPITETMQFQLQYLNDNDRRTLLDIMRSVGTSGLIYICVFPDNTNSELTQSYSIYGRSQNNSIDYALYSLYNSSLTINSW
jgi:hypothetical protein